MPESDARSVRSVASGVGGQTGVPAPAGWCCALASCYVMAVQQAAGMESVAARLAPLEGSRHLDVNGLYLLV